MAGFAITGAIALTATKIRNGGTSPLAGISHAVTVILIILFMAPLDEDIPMSALGTTLFVVAYNMSELKHFKRMVSERHAVVWLLMTFCRTVVSD